MADLKITSLPALAEAGIQATDVLALADISATETKKVTVKDIVAAAAQFLDAGDIPAAKVGTLGTNQVATGAIQDGAVTNVKLANSSISLGGVSIALGATDATPAFNLADGTGYLTSNLSGTITNAQLAGSIAGTKLSDTTITYAKLNLSDGDIPGAKIASSSITATQLAADSVGASEIAENAVGASEIGSAVITSTHVAANTLTANNLAADCIGSSELADSSVDAGALQSNAVTTIKILDANVTAAKLAANLPGSILATGAISSTQLAADSVTASELANNAVDSGAIAASAVTDAKVASGISGTKISDGTIAASKLATANIDRSLNVASGNLGINNVVTGGASTRSGITYNAQGLITETAALAASDLPIATASAVGGVSVGTGLAVTGAGALSLSNSVTAVSGATKVNYDASGQITGSSALTGSDLPAATTSAKGAVQITSGGGLTVDGSGNLTTSTSGVSAGTYQSVVVNNKGVVTAGAGLTAGQIPNLAASQITSGTFDAARIGSSTVSGIKLADSSVCQFTGATSTSGVVTFPTAEFKGQFFYDLTNDDLYVYDGSAFQPVTITSGEIIYAGNYRADTNKITSLTSAGTAQGFTVGAALQASAAANNRYYFVCDKSGTGTSPAPTVTINPPDMILSNGTTWEKLDISNFIAGQVASNIGVTATGGIQNTNVQSVLEELDTEKLNLTGGTLTGNLALNQSSSIIFEGSTPDDFETTLTVIDPTADRTVSLPNVTGTLVSSGDTGTVTSTMILDGTIVNADINASAAIALTKLAAVSAGQILVGASGTGVITAVGVTGDISINAAGLVSITADSIVNADIKSDAAIAGSKIVAGTTSVVGVVQLVDSVSSASTSLAATGASVKAVNDALTTTTATANAAVEKAGDTMTGNLIIDNAKQIRFTEADANGANFVSLQAPDALAADVTYTLPSAAPTANGQVLASTTGGVLSWTEDPTGGWVTSGNDISYSAGDVSFIGASANLKWDKSTDDLIFNDGAKAVFGTDSDGLEIYHDGTESWIHDSGTGDLNILASDLQIKTADDSDFYMTAVALGAVSLYYNGAKTFETIEKGAIIRGKAGGDGELQLYADAGSANADLWRLKAESGAAEFEIGNYANGSSWEKNIRCNANNSVQLYYDDGNPKFETTSTGATVTGTLVSDGLDVNGNSTFGANGSISAGGNFTLNSNALTVTGTSGTVIEGKKAGSSTIQVTNTSDNTELQLRADATGGLVRTAGAFPLLLGTSQEERLRIDSSGRFLLAKGTPDSTTSQFQIGESAGGYSWDVGDVPQVLISGVNNEAPTSGSKNIALRIEDENANNMFQVFNTGGGNSDLGQVFIAGKLGIGLESPSNALDVQGGTTNTAIVARSTDAKAQISLVDNSTTGVGSVAVGAEGDQLFLTSGSNGTTALIAAADGTVVLNHNGSTRLTTNAAGVEFGGNLSTASGNSFTINAGGASGTAAAFIARCGSENAIVANANGSVDLYYDGSTDPKFETTSEGVETQGELHFKAPSNSIGEQVGRIEWWNENDAGVMAKIGVDRTADQYAPADLVFSTNANVDTTANGSDGDITERMRIQSDGDVEVGGNLKTNNLSGRNILYNGSMICSQRGTSFSFAHDGTTTAYTTDRYKFFTTGLDAFDCTVSQDSTVPDGKGFSKSLKVLTGTAEPGVGSEERVEVWQKLEGQDLQHLAYGSSAAKKITVSFWVRSSITGTFGFSIYRNESAGDRIVNKPYTISAANTWEKKTCTINGDTVRAITNDTGSRARLVWFLLAGTDFTSGGAQSSYTGYASNTFAGGHAQSGVATTAGATWYITGIQLEIGSIATEFDHKSYGEELLSCYRYYHQITNPRMNGYIPDNASKGYVFDMQHPVPMRSAPTVTITNTGSVGGQYVFDGSSNALVTSLMGAYSMSGSDIRYTEMDLNLSGDLTDTRGAWTGSTNNTGRRSVYTFSSEL